MSVGTLRVRGLRLPLAAAEGALAQRLGRVGLTPTGGAIAVLAAGGWLAARAIGSRPMYLLVYGAVLGLLLSAIASRRRLALVLTRSQLPTRMREGQRTEVTISLSAKRRASTILLQDKVPPELGDPVSVAVASVAPGAEFEHSFTVNPRLRGVYKLGPASAVWSDPFGLTVQRQNLLGPVELIVHPTTEAVHDRVLTRMWEDPPVRPPVSKPWPTGFEFYGMREYVAGDDVRRIVWKAVAKTDRVLVRESEQGITDRCVIALDTNRAVHQPGRPSATFETAVRVAASLGARHLRDGFAVTLLGGHKVLGRQLRGSQARTAMLDELARVQLSNKPLHQVGADLIREARRGAHFAVITPHLDKEMSGRLRLVTQAGVSLVVVLVMTEDTDTETISRATQLGCPVVEVPIGMPLETVFANVQGRGIRR